MQMIQSDTFVLFRFLIGISPNMRTHQKWLLTNNYKRVFEPCQHFDLIFDSLI